MEKLDNVIFWQGCEKIISYIIVETEDDTNPMEENFSVLSKMNLPFWPATKLLEFLIKREWQTYEKIYTKTRMVSNRERPCMHVC